MGYQIEDRWLQFAIDEIANAYSEQVSVFAKRKSLGKFGRTTNADNGVKTTVGTFLGSEVNETFATTNAIDGVVSAGAGDSDDQVLTVEGHYYDASNNLVFHVQDVTLNGQTKASLSQPLCRATRAYVKNGTFASPATTPQGPVYVYASSGVSLSLGVPQTDSSVKLVMAAGFTQTEKCATSVSYQDYWILTRIAASVERGNASTVTCDIDVEFRQQGGVWRPLGLELSLRTASASWADIHLNPYLIIPSNTDVRMIAISNTNDTTVSGRIAGVLALVT